MEDDIWEQEAARRRAEDEAAETPAAQARRVVRRRKDFLTGVRLGWWDEEGNPLADPDESDPDQEDDED